VSLKEGSIMKPIRCLWAWALLNTTFGCGGLVAPAPNPCADEHLDVATGTLWKPADEQPCDAPWHLATSEELTTLTLTFSADAGACDAGATFVVPRFVCVAP
jgi:hypothetical protein